MDGRVKSFSLLKTAMEGSRLKSNLIAYLFARVPKHIFSRVFLGQIFSAPTQAMDGRRFWPASTTLFIHSFFIGLHGCKPSVCKRPQSNFYLDPGHGWPETKLYSLTLYHYCWFYDIYSKIAICLIHCKDFEYRFTFAKSMSWTRRDILLWRGCATNEWIWAGWPRALLQRHSACFALYANVLLAVVGRPAEPEAHMDVYPSSKP